MTDNLSIGIVGLGNIGGGMATRLAQLGRTVVGYDISAEAKDRAAAAGVDIAGSLAELAERCNVVMSSLVSIAAVEKTYLAPGGLAAIARPGTVLIECSTLPTEVAMRITAACDIDGRFALEAPVIGQHQEAVKGQLFFLLSGREEAVKRANETLSLLGRGYVHLGASGNAAAAKLINNAIGAVSVCAIAEGIALAKDLGIDPDAFVRLVNEGKGAGYSVIFERHAAFMANWRKSARSPTPIALKDAESLAALMGKRDVALPFLAGMSALYRRLLQHSPRAMAESLAKDAEDRINALKEKNLSGA